MGTMFLGEIKKQTSSFIHEKCKSARLLFTDVTQAELLTEDATNDDPSGPDARTMTRISEAAFDTDDYWRIVDVLHQRLFVLDWNHWRQQYKALVLLDFLLTHGPESVAEEFQCDVEIIQELKNFKHVDENGFNWGAVMQNRSERILRLLEDEDLLKDERLKALKISKEIQGFGNLLISPSCQTSRTSSAGSYSSSSSSPHNESDEAHRQESQKPNKEFDERFQEVSQEKWNSPSTNNKDVGKTHLWDTPVKEASLLLEHEEEDEEDMKKGYSRNGKAANITSPRWQDSGNMFRSFSHVGKIMKKKFDRQFSIGF